MCLGVMTVVPGSLGLYPPSCVHWGPCVVLELGSCITLSVQVRRLGLGLYDLAHAHQKPLC